MASAQTVGNPGFESAITYDVAPNPGNWLAFFGPVGTQSVLIDTANPHSGSQDLITTLSGAANGYNGVQQPILGIEPGVEYTMSVWAKSVGNVFNGVQFRIEWTDGNGAIIGNQFGQQVTLATPGGPTVLTSTYQQFSITATAPMGTARCNLVLAIETFDNDGTNFDTNVVWDDVSFVVVPLPTQAACCTCDGSCVVALLNMCPTGSSQQAAGTTCVPSPCSTVSTGACCNTKTGACTSTTSAICTALGGSYLGDGIACSSGACPAATGACCHGTTCTTTTAAACTGTNAGFLGAGSVCSPVARSGVVNVCCKADFNGTGGVTVQDIFDFLSAWFAKCP